MIETEAISKEAELQNIMRKGFRIIQPSHNLNIIYMKLKGKRGWVIFEKFDSHPKMIKRLLELGAMEKTLIYND